MRYLKIAALLFSTLFFSSKSKAQLQVDYLEILKSSSRITYIGLKYSTDEYLFKPDYNLIGTAMEMMQRRYDASFNNISHEYRKLKDLKLINFSNVELLKRHQLQVENWMERNLKNADLSQPDVTRQILDYITSIYKMKSIMDEIKHLQYLNELYLFALEFNVKNNRIDCFRTIENNISGILKKITSSFEYQLSKSPEAFVDEYMTEKTNNGLLKSDSIYLSVTSKYKLISIYKKIPEGWSDAYLVSIQKVPLYKSIYGFSVLTTKVYVSNNKIALITRKSGNTQPVISSSFIKNQKADVILLNEKCDMTSEQVPYFVYIF
jgi:hypothetical protein